MVSSAALSNGPAVRLAARAPVHRHLNAVDERRGGRGLPRLPGERREPTEHASPRFAVGAVRRRARLPARADPERRGGRAGPARGRQRTEPAVSVRAGGLRGVGRLQRLRHGRRRLHGVGSGGHVGLPAALRRRDLRRRCWVVAEGDEAIQRVVQGRRILAVGVAPRVVPRQQKKR